MYSNLILIVIINTISVSPIGQLHAQEPNKIPKTHGIREHAHPITPPCKVCPNNGVCVPRVRCPSHVRSPRASCHVRGVPAVCCYARSRHTVDFDEEFREAAPISSEDMKLSHQHSQHRLANWLDLVKKLLPHRDTVLNVSSPSYAHYLSVKTHDERAEELGRAGLLGMFSAEHLLSRQALTEEQITLGLTDHTDAPYCPAPSSCPVASSRYRSKTGDCNNANYTTWGAVHTAFERLLPPDYSDGIWAMRSSSSGLPLPNPRLVSSTLLLEASHPSTSHNLMFMQFGQFIAHDTSAGVIFTLDNSTVISCCLNDGQDMLPEDLQHPACAPIQLPDGDPFFSQFQKKCLNFVRTQIAPSADCSVSYAKQMNGATHFLDLSHLYGSSEEKFISLRAPDGLLKTFNDYGRELPPLAAKKDCITVKEGAACFESGDNHGNQVISLTVLHTIFTREHNKIARALTKLNPHWDEDTVFYEARRIVQAEFQHIIYTEWLPLLIGPDLMQAFELLPSVGYSSGYDHNVNPSLTAEFSAAAMRFGHSVVDGHIIVPSPQRNRMYEMVSLPEVMFQPARMRLRPFLDRLLTGLSWQPMQSVDPFVSEALTRYLFHGGQPYGIDLAAINIQRGRDWGVRSYNEYRRLCGFQPVQDFSQVTPNTAQRLSSVYASPEDIDLWVGGLLEEPIPGGVVGETFAHIIADQFTRLKKGDRYFYEYGHNINPGAFSLSQLSEIKKVTLSRIICDNRDGIELMSQPPNAFLRADLPRNEPVPCESPVIPAMDLSKFKEN